MSHCRCLIATIAALLPLLFCHASRTTWNSMKGNFKAAYATCGATHHSNLLLHVSVNILDLLRQDHCQQTEKKVVEINFMQITIIPSAKRIRQLKEWTNLLFILL
jgi:hypothetical protein